MSDPINGAPVTGAEDATSAHQAQLQALQPVHENAVAKLETLKLRLGESLAKAQADASHVDYAASFVRDVELKADEILSWIARHI